ncbi:MAG: hypothetical protein GX139_12255 [Armatimonadetes bacterium]|nr:hypothetical protein [Armatimonadota bacterium]
MSDRKTLAIILGVTVGVAAVATAVGVYINKKSEPIVEDVNDIFDKARNTVRRLNEAVDGLRKSAV